jgi:ribosomal protein L23
MAQQERDKTKEQNKINKEKNAAVKKKSALSRIKDIIKKEETKPEAAKAVDIDPFRTLKFVLMTEKAIRMIELQNKLVFIVNMKSDKKQVKAAVEAAFQTPVNSVKTMIDQKGRKKAFIKFKEPGQAGEIAIRLGII